MASAAASQWIINRNEDILCFIGSSVLSYLVLAAWLLGAPLLPFFLIWILCLDGPHVMATVTRTYFDPSERNKLGLWLWVIVPASLIGPIAILGKQADLFYLFAVAWQHFHIAKQHFGFVMLYKRKNRERDRFDFKLDRYFLLSSTMLPFAWFVQSTHLALQDPAWMLFRGLLAVAYVALAVVFVGRQVQKLLGGIPLNVPKLSLFAVLVPLQWLAFWYAAQFGAVGIIRAGILLGIFHSIQYHRLLWFHNRNRYVDYANRQRFGLASILSRRFVYYAAVAIGLNLVLNFIPATFLGKIVILPAALWGIAFTHYVLDSRIWRVREDRELAAALRL